MDTDLSHSRSERSDERHWGCSSLRKSVKGNYLEEFDIEKVNSRDRKRCRTEDRDHRSGDKNQSKTKHSFKERENDARDFRKERFSRKEKSIEGTKEKGEDGTKDIRSEKDLDREEKRRNVHDRNDKDRERRRDLEGQRETEQGSDRGQETERGKEKGKDKSRYRDSEKRKAKPREKEKEQHHDKNKAKSERSGDFVVGRDTYTQGQTFPEEDTRPFKQDYVLDTLVAQDIEERISNIKEERVKSRFESVSESLSMINKSRKFEESVSVQRHKAKQRSKILDEQDNVDDEGFTGSERVTNALAEVKVLHGLDKVLEVGTVIWTLEDQEILAGGDVNDNVDMLENVEIGEQKCRNEAYKAGKNFLYGDKSIDHPDAKKKMLPPYDDAAEEEGVTLDVDGRSKIEELQIPSRSNQVEDLNISLRISSDYNTPEEMLKFKKHKKSKSLRKREKFDVDALEAEARAQGLGASDICSRSDSRTQISKEEEERAEAKRRCSAYQAAFAGADDASRALRIEQTLSMVRDEDDVEIFAEDAADLQKSLERARKLASKKQTEKALIGPEAIAHLATATVRSQSLDAQKSPSGDALENKVVFTEMDEFVWGLELDKDTRKPSHENVFMEEDEPTKAWTEVMKSGMGKPSMTEERVIDYTFHEHCVGKGLSGTLKLSKERDLLEELDGKNKDKIKKDEFRMLSYIFHGVGPGKRKQEKRIKQRQDEVKSKQR